MCSGYSIYLFFDDKQDIDKAEYYDYEVYDNESKWSLRNVNLRIILFRYSNFWRQIFIKGYLTHRVIPIKEIFCIIQPFSQWNCIIARNCNCCLQKGVLRSSQMMT